VLNIISVGPEKEKKEEKKRRRKGAIKED